MIELELIIRSVIIELGLIIRLVQKFLPMGRCTLLRVMIL